MFSQEPLDEIVEQLREYATSLTHQDSKIADDVLLARTELESALESENSQEHITNAYEHLQLALQIDQINKNHQDELTDYLDMLKPHTNQED